MEIITRNESTSLPGNPSAERPRVGTGCESNAEVEFNADAIVGSGLRARSRGKSLHRCHRPPTRRGLRRWVRRRRDTYGTIASPAKCRMMNAEFTCHPERSTYSCAVE